MGSLLTDVNWGPNTAAVQGTVHHSFDNNFWVTAETINSANSVSYQYDSDGLLTAAGSLNLYYDPNNGLLTSMTIGSGSSQLLDSISYSTFGELATYQASYGSTTLLSETYTRDAIGRITQKVEVVQGTSHTYNYTYDLAGRLTQVKKDGTVVSSYSYDTNGNRSNGTVNGSSSNGTYDAQDRLTGYGSISYTYTANGDLLSKTVSGATTHYTYDVLGNLTGVSYPGGGVSYKVDGQNRRIQRSNSGGTQGYLYGSQLQIVAQLDGSNNVVSRFVYGMGGNAPDYMVKSGTTYRIIKDHLGSPRLVVNTSTGAVAQRMDFDEFGNVLTDTSPGFQPFGFAGGLYDKDTKLSRFGARDYDPVTGRWLAKDPLRFGGGDTNLYGYTLSDPVNLVDTTGLKPGDCYKTMDEAGLAALREYNPQSISNNIEYGGWILRMKKKNKCVGFTYTLPTYEDPNADPIFYWTATEIGCYHGAQPSNAAAGYHTHAAPIANNPGDERFSCRDMETADSNHLPEYLGTPRGQALKFVPPSKGKEKRKDCGYGGKIENLGAL